MNRERLQMVRDRIAAEPPERLDLNTWHCGTAHCIGGWAQVLDREQRGVSLKNMRHTASVASIWLGLDEGQYQVLFYSGMFRHTRDDALAALDSLIHADSDDALPVWPEPHA